ncbi:MAG: DMT family transporter [Deltaproteobacteria bacterium]|uniref:DMT family transporter n=1 Tax=Desulfobacula sp. TaxID=2593537 RepID=UPI0019A521BA|nr:DMT family transporter [Candidatus Desulfobacula maris]MBL6993997.1 DMT family transporter [Desulfobacula sp.]
MSNNLKPQSLFAGYLFAIGATAIWSGNFIVARGLSESIPPISLAFYRWLVAVIVFTPFAIKALVQEWVIIKKHVIYFSITSFLGITTFNTIIYFAGHTTTAMNLSLISITFPIFILLFSRILFKEFITIKKGVGITLVLSGVLFLITKGKFSTLLSISFNIGDVWMLLAAIIFAIYSLFLKSKPKGLSIIALQFSTFILGLIFLLPFFLWEQTMVHQSYLNQTTIPAILYVGIFASLCAFVLWNKAIVVLGPSKAGMVYYTLPLFSGFLGYLFLHESIRMIHFYSMILIFSGIIVTNHEPKNPNLTPLKSGNSS